MLVWLPVLSSYTLSRSPAPQKSLPSTWSSTGCHFWLLSLTFHWHSLMALVCAFFIISSALSLSWSKWCRSSWGQSLQLGSGSQPLGPLSAHWFYLLNISFIYTLSLYISLYICISIYLYLSIYLSIYIYVLYKKIDISLSLYIYIEIYSVLIKASRIIHNLSSSVPLHIALPFPDCPSPWRKRIFQISSQGCFSSGLCLALEEGNELFIVQKWYDMVLKDTFWKVISSIWLT
jgi:hypothetical protein